MHEKHSSAFRAASIDIDGRAVRYCAAGEGAAIVDFQPGARPARMHELLAASHRVLIFEPFDSGAGLSDRAAKMLAHALRTLAIDPFNLILRAASWPGGAAASHANAAAPRALVLLAPIAGPAEHHAALDLPMLVLVGTGAAAASLEAGRRLREHGTNCHLVLVYDAADDLDAERPEAVAGAIADFVAQPERFLVATASGQLYP